ncbi:MAG: hypothetical protein RL329_3724 [Bacteroidota bacterium]|jgi:predicted  nucleic acid-binding Zn-ribbon protein
MSSITPIQQPDTSNFKIKSFWEKPEGVTGMLFMAAILLGGGYLFMKILPTLVALAANTLYLAGMLAVLGAIVYMVLDPKMRNLVWYMYKSVMRWITGIFVTIDPVGILKTYVDSLQDNLGKMSKQIGNLQGQMRSMQNLMEGNKREIDGSMKLASQAKIQNNEAQIVLHTRKAARLQESNEKYNNLFKRMELLKKVLSKMYENSEILLEDTKDQVKVKEQERQAIRTSHSAMKSAMNILSGSPDQRMMFDMAMENINNDVAMKVGEMERFMEMSSGFMNSIDLQNGVFEEEGLKMLDDWEKKSSLMLTGGKISADDKLELKAPPTKEKSSGNTPSSNDNSYDSLFK